jgi:F-box protein, helicase, 18
MQPTLQQQAILQTNGNLVINAVAGSGKTTTLLAYAKTRPPGSRILYLAFNKTVKEEALQKFAAAGLHHVKAETAHSLAFDHVVKHSRYKVVQGYKNHEWVDLLGIDTGDRHTDYILASHINKCIAFFCNSQAAKVQELDYAATLSDPKAKQFVNNFHSPLIDFTRKALDKMNRGEIAVTHDFYLKKFQLGKPLLPYDYILFDEGQDASAAMLDVFLRQSSTKVIVGDVHQQIYGWRYAVNSLQQVDFERLHLTESFRFDEEIALVANRILGWKQHLQQPGTEKIIGIGRPGPILSQATLGRTNLQLLLNAIVQVDRGLQQLHFEGKISSYTFADEGASLYDVLNLHTGKTTLIKDKLVASMKDLKELEDYIEKTEDHSLGLMVEMVKQYGNQLPGLIGNLKSKHTDKREDAEMVFSTVHRCKGMEYDSVTLLPDFMTEEKLLKTVAAEGVQAQGHYNRLAEEVNLLYVAVTRAKSKLVLPPEINPLKSVVVAAAPAPPPITTNRDDLFLAEMELFHRRHSGESRPIRPKPGNSGKRWTDEETTLLSDLYLGNNPLAAIARELGRGPNAVRIKLQQIGLLEEGDIQ